MSIDATSVHELLELTCSSKNPSGSAGFCATRFGQARSRTSSTPCCLRYSTASGGTPRRACLRIFYHVISPRKNTHLYYSGLNNSQYIPGIQVSFKMKLRTPCCSKCFLRHDEVRATHPGEVESARKTFRSFMPQTQLLKRDLHTK